MVPLTRAVENVLELTTWYKRTFVRSATEIFAGTASNAALMGAKMVMLGRVSTAPVKLAVTTAVTNLVKLAAVAVELVLSGIVRTISTIWITPLLQLISAVTTEAWLIITFAPLTTACKFWPCPFFSTYELLVKSVGGNEGVAVIWLAITTEPRTW